MKRIKLALIIAALTVATTACAQEQIVEPVASETTPIVVEIEETEVVSDDIPAELVTETYVPSPAYKPATETVAPEPIPEPAKPTAQVAMFEDNNQVVIEVVYEGNCYIGNVHEQLFQQNITEGTEIPVHAIQGSFITIEGFEEQIWYEFQGDELWTLDESYLGFVPNANEEYTLFVSDNWTTECNDKETHGENCECAVYDDFFICVQDY